MTKRVVLKFGGADLATSKKVLRAAKMVIESPYDEIVVVVSAMGKMTDNLVDTLSRIGKISDTDYAETISMGERVSARIFCSALKGLGAKADFFDPAYINWPIITNSSPRNAKPNLEKTEKQIHNFLLPLLGDTIPVVCGFLGKDEKGRITTLGRGGSDTTALLLGKFLNVDETILVKETSGVLSADPKILPEARPLETLDIHEMFDLVRGGAKIVKPEALRYKAPNQKLRIVSISSKNIAEGGTEIIGSFNLNSVEIEKEEHLLAINLVCEVNSQNLKEIFSVFHQKPIYGVSSGKKSITIFTSESDFKGIMRKLHKLEGLKAISHREEVAMLQIIHPLFVDSPGFISRISKALSDKEINILEATTSKATINFFIEGNALNSALEAIGGIFEA